MADRYPIAAFHVLVVPQFHLPDVFDLCPAEYASVAVLTRQVVHALRIVSSSRRIGAFTSGKEVSEHAHVHLLPLDSGLKKTFSRLKDASRLDIGSDGQREVLQKIAEVME